MGARTQSARYKHLLRPITIISSVMVLALSAPLTAFAKPPSPLLPATDSSRQIANLFWITLAIAVVVFALVEGLLIYAIARYRNRGKKDEVPQIDGNPTLEMMWTIVPALIMVVLFTLAWRVLSFQHNAPPDATTIEVTGHQWYWEFNYPDTEVTLQNELVIPANVPVLLEISSTDVIHSFWVPQLEGKADAIPGHTNILWFEADEGTYAGQCAEFCGREHYAMLFDVKALPPDEYDAWMQDQIDLAAQFQPIGTDMETPLPAGDPASGEALFTELGCNSCHTLDGSQLVGPSLLGVGERAGTRIDGYDAQQYLRESILLPCDYVVEGFTCVMPQNFGERLEAKDLADLIAFLSEQ